MESTFQSTLNWGSLIALATAFFTAVIKTRAFVEWLDRHWLNGTPKVISDIDIELINAYFAKDEIVVNSILAKQPRLRFRSFEHCTEVADAVRQDMEGEGRAEQLRLQQHERGMPDDPHAFVYNPPGEPLTVPEGSNQHLPTYAIGAYTQLLALPPKIKNSLLVLGANNLVIDPASAEFVLHVRGDTAETQSGKVHGFGGGYMPYWEGGHKTQRVRRDDCKNLRYTAMRELHEESGMLSLDHVPQLVCVIEERHTSDLLGKFGYLTFFFVTLLNDYFAPTFAGDLSEGSTRRIVINRRNIRSMIIKSRIGKHQVHPQLRAMLVVWVFLGCPGLHFTRRFWLSNWFSRRSLRAALN